MPRDPTYTHVSISPEIDRFPFSHFQTKGWSLEVECWSCKRVVYFSPDELVERFGPDKTPGDLSRRLRCVCGLDLPAMRAVRR